MRPAPSRAPFVVALLALIAVGCGSNDAPPTSPDDAGVDSTSFDTATDAAPADTTTDDASEDTLDTATPDATDSAVEDATDSALDDATDSALDDATDSAVDDATDSAVDASDSAVDASDDAFDSATADASDAETGAPTRVRVVAANLTSGNAQSYEAPGIRILQGLQADVVLVQEMNYSGTLRQFVDTTFGTSFHFMVETGAQIPNGIVSRYPIIESGEWDDPEVANRDFAWARIDVPGPIDLWAVSVHLLTSSAGTRDTEAKRLVDYVRAKVPASDYLVVGGDLNTDSATELAFASLSGIVVSAPPYAVDQVGKAGTNSSRSKPYDWVMPSPSLLARMIPVRVGSSDFPYGLVVDTRVYTPIIDLSPALTGDSGSSNMQHMAVVRDFALGN